MKRSYLLILTACYLLFTVMLAGCAGAREVCKGMLGVSTKVLEDGRKDAIKKEFNYDLVTCHNKIKAILKDTGAYIYCDDVKKDMLAVYVSEEDTTPVGVFLTETSKNRTLVEVSGPSTYGKEIISKAIFESLTTGTTKPVQKGLINASKAKTEHKKSH